MKSVDRRSKKKIYKVKTETHINSNDVDTTWNVIKRWS